MELFDLSFEASKRLSKRKEKNGELKLDTREAKLIVNEEGKVTDVKVRVQRESERLIEDLMVATNEAGARYVSDMGLKFLFRNHEYPDLEKLEMNFIPLCKSLKIQPRFQNDNYAHEYKRIMSLVEDETVRNALSDAFLRCLPKAVYAPDNIGHFGLASDAYMQVTSPIRRYPDLIAHRLIKQYMFEPENFEKLNFEAIYQYLHEAGITTSSQERRAEQLERDVTKMKMAEYMEDKVGETFVGKISGFTEKGMFVQLPNMIEGYVKFEYLIDDTYIYDRDRLCAFGKRSNKVMKIGDPYKIRVARASKAEAIIDFGPVDYKPKKTDELGKDFKKKGRR